MAVRKGDYFDELETMDPGARRKYLDEKLEAAVNHAYKYAPAVKKFT